MLPIFYDTHAHLDYPDFADELPQVVARAQAAGIDKIISIGTDLESSRRAIKLAEEFPNVFAVIGWHPSEVNDAPADLRPALRELAAHPRVAALGETGLDYHRLPSTSRRSKEVGKDIGAEANPLSREEIEKAKVGDGIYKQKQAELFRHRTTARHAHTNPSSSNRTEVAG